MQHLVSSQHDGNQRSQVSASKAASKAGLVSVKTELFGPVIDIFIDDANDPDWVSEAGLCI